jgi:ferredoxin-NADP reductase
MTKLIDRHEVAERTMAFQFEKPAGWTFKAGQFVDVKLLNPPETDAEGDARALSIASAPHEPMIMVATRMRDTAFKRVLQSMPLNTEVKIEGPFGNLTLHNNAARPAVLLAGGIGITPFRSMVANAAKEKLAHKIFLFYSNRRPEDAAFLEELQAFEQQNPNFKLVATMTEIEKSNRPWKGEVGKIDAPMLERHLKPAGSPEQHSAEPIYYIAGPPQMGYALQSMLTNSSVNSDDIRMEEFIGY